MSLTRDKFGPYYKGGVRLLYYKDLNLHRGGRQKLYLKRVLVLVLGARDVYLSEYANLSKDLSGRCRFQAFRSRTSHGGTRVRRDLGPPSP